ncbi:unnamed protein product [Blepharisma stoltei]|uniref:PA domain-containing protein n=1 Tax=Blepharisma stoltei TaxID=1481888 RepID=A0AAU9J2M1_9CILI|nr:unnamed protein product [Blepharisma stoltei]
MSKFLIVCLLGLVVGKMYVYSPDALRQEMQSRYQHGEIRNSLANFGNPPYGSVIIGRVFYRDSQSDACQAMQMFDWTDDPDQINTPILLVRRGSCPFVMKARHAQDIGARALIVIDNKDENPESIIMIDNGSAGNIFIPTFLISKSDGELLLKYINNNVYARHVAISLTFTMPHNGNKISYGLYMSSENAVFYDFLKDFASLGSEIAKTEAAFQPHYVTKTCIPCSSNNFKQEEANCLSGGRYCIDPPTETSSGRDYVYENLREICIYRQTDSKDNYALWFNYIKHFHEFCSGGIVETCVNSAMTKANVNVKKVNQCIEESFSGKNHLIDDNQLLKDAKDFWGNIAVSYYPALVINNQTYRGDWEVDPVRRGLCAGYSYGQDPSFCKEEPTVTEPENEGIGAWSIILILLLCVVLVGAILVFYRMWIRREMKGEMRRQVNTAVTQYFALADSSSVQLGERQAVRVSYN